MYIHKQILVYICVCQRHIDSLTQENSGEYKEFSEKVERDKWSELFGTLFGEVLIKLRKTLITLSLTGF